MSETFCVLPWKHLTVRPDGSPHLCAVANEPVFAREGRPMFVHEHSLEEIWNSEPMRQIRQDMLEGKRVAPCETCYRQEEAGGASVRISSNQNWLDGWLNEERWGLAQLRTCSASLEHRMPAPGSLDLSMGKQCNLKCRMCDAGSSSRIARDPVHSRWAPGVKRGGGETRPWWQVEAVRRDLLRHPEQLRWLYFLGGEPLIIKEVGDYLRVLIDVGVAHRVRLMATTNGTTTNSPWLKLVPAFESLILSVSLDGFGRYQEYIRYPALWVALARNLPVFRALPKTRLMAHVTLQAYNVLNIVELFRFLDAAGIPFTVFSLFYPEHLRASVLPPRARRRAAGRLRDYAEQECAADRRATVLTHASALESLGESFDAKLLRRFMVFTNDLDVTRGQSFRETCPELLQLIEEAGFFWTDETLHAGRRTLPLAAI